MTAEWRVYNVIVRYSMGAISRAFVSAYYLYYTGLRSWVAMIGKLRTFCGAALKCHKNHVTFRAV